MTLEEAVAEFLGALGSERGLARNTVNAYRRDLRPYVDILAEMGLEDVAAVTPDAVSGFVRHLNSAGLAPATVARKVSAVRGLHRFLVTEDLTSSDPTSTLESPRRPATLPKALTVDEVFALLEKPDRSTRLGTRDAALLEFLYASGGASVGGSGPGTARPRPRGGHGARDWEGKPAADRSDRKPCDCRARVVPPSPHGAAPRA